MQPKSKKVLQDFDLSTLGKDFRFSPRQLEVARLILKRKGRKAIAAELGIAETTVRAYCDHLFKKTQVADRTDFILWIYGIR